MKRPPRVVRKYANRRLYDTRESRYVNLDELMELFAGDDKVRVVDAVSGADLTDRTLRQALLGERSALVPAQLLRACLRYRGRSRTAFERHMVAALADFRPRAR